MATTTWHHSFTCGLARWKKLLSVFDDVMLSSSPNAKVIDLGDQMDFTPLYGVDADTLSCNMEGVPTDSTNLVIKVRTSVACCCLIRCLYSTGV